jgi:hypothetical protein
MFYIEWCKEHRKTKATTAITACPLCLLKEIDLLREEKLAALQCSRDNVAWFEALKADFDALVNAVETSGVAKTSQEISDVLESFKR